MAPLITRRVGPSAPPLRYAWDREPAAREPLLSEDMKLFLTGWLGGLVFFGTLFS